MLPLPSLFLSIWVGFKRPFGKSGSPFTAMGAKVCPTPPSTSYEIHWLGDKALACAIQAPRWIGSYSRASPGSPPSATLPTAALPSESSFPVSLPSLSGHRWTLRKHWSCAKGRRKLELYHFLVSESICIWSTCWTHTGSGKGSGRLWLY